MKKTLLLVLAASITFLALGCAKPDEGDSTTTTKTTTDQTPKTDGE